MNIDALVLGLLAIGDLGLFLHLRHKRHGAAQKERMMACLVIAVRRENLENPIPEEQVFAQAS